MLSYAFVLCRDTEAEALRVRDQIIAAGDVEAARNMARQRSWGSSADAPDTIRDIVLSLGTRTFIGTPQSIFDDLQAYFAVGLDGLLFTFYDFELDLYRFADQILPHLSLSD